ncbi:MAG: DUF378 domain-containing protein [Rhodobacterales bacterium 32-66-7]|nr:MAG: DUF378 domain-containing protein [Rhodobacterales bacterium 32-66-7]OZA01602.1 MAG: DUF378 domain-containing protein [Rhodobacterales bacterium 17-64-5]
MRALNALTLILIIVGGINWLLVGAFEFDLVAALFGGQTAVLSKIVYILVGLSAIWQLIRLPAHLNYNPDLHSTTNTRTGDHL